MLKVVFLFLFIAVVLSLVAWIKKKTGKEPVAFPYQSKGVLCSPAERSFMGALDKAVSNEYRIFAKVRMGDIVEVKKKLSPSARQSARNRIDRKHLDFVICHSRDLSIVGAIELDDISHLKKERKERDQFLNKALEAAEIPILRVKAQGTYSLKALSSDLDTAFNISVGAYLEKVADPPETIQEPKQKNRLLKRQINRLP